MKEQVNLKSVDEVKKMMRAGNIVAKCHTALANTVLEGKTLLEVDKFVNKIIEDNGGKSIIKNYDGFPGYNCISVNDLVVHGIPDQTVLKNGDIVGIDISVILDGYVADSCWSYPVGQISSENQYLLEHTEKALFKGLSQVQSGVKLGTLSYAIEKYAKRHNLSVVKELAGHGIGQNLHEDPMVPNYGKKGRGLTMEQGLTIAVEPMLNLGDADIYLDDDKWDVYTEDGSNSAHFEHTIVVTKTGYEIITKERSDEEIANFSFE